MKIRLRQLRAFVELAKTQNFTQAAQNLFITQSALSSLIKQMELNLGLPLFDRSTRHVSLTDVGQDLYPYIDQILIDLGNVLEEAANLKALKKGLVRIAAPQLLACTLLPQSIAAFQQLYPEIQVQLIDCGVEQIETKVLSNEVDLGISPERDHSTDIHPTLLFESAFCVVSPKEHPFNQHHTIAWHGLQDQPLILLQGQFTKKLSGDLDSTEFGPELNLRPVSQVNFMSTALSLVNSGLGLTICLPYARSLVEAYGLSMQELSPAVVRRFYTYERQGRTLAPAVAQFKKHLLHTMNQPH